LIEWTGERCVPWAPDVQVVYEHMHRYLWAAEVVAGRRVLDLGSGEGFGASILSSEATEVVGVDIDQQTVEHARLNWSGPRTSFNLGSALDLSEFEDGSFGAVVAFEIIEHVEDQERVLVEVARVLADDGVLVISTPDRRLYSDATGQVNPFHQHELTHEEFSTLLEKSFEHVAMWGQRTITGSHLGVLDAPISTDEVTASEFFIERAGEEWRVAGEPAALYLVALVSKAPLPDVPSLSMLGDCGLELVRTAERSADDAARSIAKQRDESLERERLAKRTMERERGERQTEIERHSAVLEQHSVELAQRDEYLSYRQTEIDALRTRLEGFASLGEELAQAHRFNRRVEESVTWQAFQRLRGRVFSSIGETSLLARSLRVFLRLAGRIMTKRHTPAQAPEVAQAARAPVPALEVAETITLPSFEQPLVSLVVPLFAQADLTRRCLKTIRDNTNTFGYEVILVDDAADSETKQLLESVSGAQVLVNESNQGYLRSVNRGAALAHGRWLVLCNNDIEVQPGWLEAMLDCAESAEDIGVVTPKFVYPDGSLCEAGGIIWRDGTGVNYGRGESPDGFQYEYRRETDYGSAAALMVRTQFWQDIGGFDERYLPMYFEDTDICFEARERGLRVLYEPEAVVVHLEGATAGTDIESGHKRHQERNRPKFVAKWRRRLESEHLRAAPSNLRLAANRHRGKHVLVIDHRVPMWDRDSGSLRMFNMMRELIGLGARVTFMPDNFAPVQPYTRRLQRLGIEVIYGSLNANAELATIGPKLSAAILSRPHATSRWLDVVREFAPSATVAYDTVDLHWLREARRGAAAERSSDAMSNGAIEVISAKAQALRELELAMIRASDVTLVVTDSECLQVERDVPGARVLVVPNVHDVQSFVAPAATRSGILFVGSFEHPPNLDAAVRLVREVMPVVWRELGDVRVTIVGSNPPPEVQVLASPLVDIVGWVEDLQPLLDGSRLMVAPLRYGAGMKGKVTQCLAAGLPVVTTSIGAEGLLPNQGPEEDALPQGCLLVADESLELAAHAVRASLDDELWQRLSRAGQTLIAELCSTEEVSRRLELLLDGQLTSSAVGAVQPG
jgi:O-antigen biosynthesis protein